MKKEKKMPDTLIDKIRVVVNEMDGKFPAGMNSKEITAELRNRGWINEWTNVLDVADAAHQYYGKP